MAGLGEGLARIAGDLLPAGLRRAVAVEVEPPEERGGVADDVDRQALGDAGADLVLVDPQRGGGVALFERDQGGVPGEVAVQDAGGVVGRQPAGDQGLGGLAVAALEHGVGQGMDAVGVGAAQRQGPLDHLAATGDLAVLGQGPAVAGQEPPVVVGEIRGVAGAEIDAGLVVLGHAGEREQAECAERHRQHQHVARPAVGVGEGGAQGLGRATGKGELQDPDVAPFPLGSRFGDQRAGRGDLLAHLLRLGAQRIGAGAAGAGQGEVRIGGDGRIERGLGAGPGGEDQAYALAIVLGGLGGGGRKRQIVGVEVHGRKTTGMAAIATTSRRRGQPNIRGSSGGSASAWRPSPGRP